MAIQGCFCQVSYFMVSGMEKTNQKKRKICRQKFLHYFKKGFPDPKFDNWERGYKWNAHLNWESQLNKKEFRRLLDKQEFYEIANRAVRIETKTNLLFSFEIKVAYLNNTETST